MKHRERIDRDKERVQVSLSMREVEALLPVLAVGKMEIEVSELYSARQMIALERAISKIQDAEVRLQRRLNG